MIYVHSGGLARIELVLSVAVHRKVVRMMGIVNSRRQDHLSIPLACLTWMMACTSARRVRETGKLALSTKQAIGVNAVQISNAKR